MAEAASAAFNSSADSEVPVVTPLRQQAATTSLRAAVTTTPFRAAAGISLSGDRHTMAHAHMVAIPEVRHVSDVAMLVAIGPDRKLLETSLRQQHGTKAHYKR